ncbi:DUF7604 domain-containing protein [Bifidobacterium primatium]|uniref:DUF7604 domain-containing protein n=1 Tax=Bifidobacterium primatium TaxID=2045438 RepID=UPI0013FDE358|nr:SpaA isopeptide-forming pilin-related protein [Bifidobacterium primatium]
MKQTGAGGAGMGYASVDEDGDGTRRGDTPRAEGIAQGVLGVGLDQFGNFSVQHVYRSGTTDRITGGNDCQTEWPGGSEHLTLRGQGSLVDDKWNGGYCVVSETKVSGGFRTSGSQWSDAPGDSGKTVRVIISTPDADGYQTVSVYINGIAVVANQKLGYKLPSTIKFGFSAGTGAASQAQLIRGLTAHSLESLPDINLVKAVNKDTYPDADTHVFKEGDLVPYVFTVSNGGNTDLTNVQVTDKHIANIECPATTLAVGHSMTCNGTLTLTKEMARPGSFTNTATVTGTSGTKMVSDDDSVTINTVKGVEIVAPQHRKYIKDNGDGTYTLSLDVTGKSTASDEGNGVDVFLLADTTGSMKTDNRFVNLKQASKQLADSVLTSDNAKLGDKGVKIAAIPFATNAPADGLKKVNFTNTASDLTNTICGTDSDCSSIDDGWTMDTSGVGGTNWQATLDYVSKNANALGARADAKKIIVFVTDGAPKVDKNTDKNVEEFTPSLWNSSLDSAKALAKAGYEFINVDVTSADSDSSKSVYMDPSTQSVSTQVCSAKKCDAFSGNKTTTNWNKGDWAYGDYDSGNRPTKWKLSLNVFTDRINDAKPGIAQYLNAKGGDLQTAFKSIVAKITHTDTSYRNVTITDDLSQYAQVKDLTAQDVSKATVIAKNADGKALDPQPVAGKDYKVTYTAGTAEGANGASTGTVTLQFLNDYELKSGYTYTLSFNVRPTKQAYTDYASNGGKNQDGYAGNTGDAGTDVPGTAADKQTSSNKPGFYSNKTATLTYQQCVTTSVNGGDSASNCENGAPVSYARPVLQVKIATVTLVKTVDNTYAGKWGAAPNAWELSLRATGSNGVLVNPEDSPYKGVPDSKNVQSGSSETKPSWATASIKVPAGKYNLTEIHNDAYRHSSFPNAPYPYYDGYNDGENNGNNGSWQCVADGSALTVDHLRYVTIPAGKNVTCTATNTALPGSLTWTKTDPAGTALKGSEWTLSGPDGTKTVTVTNDKGNGSFAVNKLAWGKYTLQESKAPNGYAKDSKKYPFAVIPAVQKDQSGNNKVAVDPANPNGDVSDKCVVKPVRPAVAALAAGASIRFTAEGLDVDCGAFVNNPTVAALPLTGGTTGRAWLIASGVLLVLAGCSYLVWRKRMA